MSWARATTLRVHHRREWGTGVLVAGDEAGIVLDINATLYDTVEFRILTVPEFTPR
jgi:hypothetical protein